MIPAGGQAVKMFPLLASYAERALYRRFFPELCVPWALLAPHEAQTNQRDVLDGDQH
jgi:hypothetical protein